MEILNSTMEISHCVHSRWTPEALRPLEFGSAISDHMFMAEFKEGEWQQARIMPFGDIKVSPAMLALHYGQSVFEGMKAFATKDGRVAVFRIDRHYRRFVSSLERMCMPAPSEELFTEALLELLRIDRQWVPVAKDSSLYIRPFMFASEARFGVKVADEYRFMIITGPVPGLFAKPIRVKVETEYVRAARGGTGYVKCAGNYGGAFYPTQLARQQGFDQVIWTTGGPDAKVEESGMMNLLFVVGDTLVTAPKSDTILDGVTRDSLLTLARDRDWKVEERILSVSELEDACRSGQLKEAFGAGTAAVVAPIGHIHINGTGYDLPEPGPQARMYQLRDRLNDIRTAAVEDPYGWNTLL